MENLLSICELAYRQMFPVPRDKTSITLEEFIATGKTEYAASMWIYRQELISTEGIFDMPSELISEVEFDVVDNEIDLKDITYLSSLPGDIWLQNVGGFNCECKYIKTTLNMMQLFGEDDDTKEPNSYLYYIQGKKIKFPNGTHKKKLPVIYANMGEGLDSEMIEVNAFVASKVRLKLRQLYGEKMPVDNTNDQNTDK